MTTSNYRGNGSYSDALLLATLAGVPVIGYDKNSSPKDAPHA